MNRRDRSSLLANVPSVEQHGQKPLALSLFGRILLLIAFAFTVMADPGCLCH